MKFHTLHVIVGLTLLGLLAESANAQTSISKVIGKQTDESRKIRQKQLEMERELRNGKIAELERKQLTIQTQPETESEITSSYDKFKDETRVILSEMPIIPSHNLTGRDLYEFSYFGVAAFYVYQGQKEVTPKVIGLVFKGHSGASHFSRKPNLILLADNERIRAGSMAYEYDLIKGYMYDTISILLPYDTFYKIANSNKVEFQIDNSAFVFTGKNLEGFRKLLGIETNKGETKTPQTKPLTNVQDTRWQGALFRFALAENFETVATFTFSSGGTLRAQWQDGYGAEHDIVGMWEQQNDAIYMLLPKTKTNVNVVIVGIIKDNAIFGTFKPDLGKFSPKIKYHFILSPISSY